MDTMARLESITTFWRLWVTGSGSIILLQCRHNDNGRIDGYSDGANYPDKELDTEGVWNNANTGKLVKRTNTRSTAMADNHRQIEGQ